jgi:hypothetical protein
MPTATARRGADPARAGHRGFRADYGQAQAVIAGRIGAVQIRSTSGITAHDLLERYDATLPDGPDRVFVQTNRTRLLSLLGPPDAPAPTTGVINSVREWTVYGEGSVRALAGLLLTGGLRATRTTLDGSPEDMSVAVQGSETAQRSQTILLLGGVALVDLAPRTKLFLRYQQGFRPGGLAIESDYVRQFRNDRVATIETGVRHGWSIADLGVTLARAAWRDIQADFIDNRGLPSTANIGNGRLWTVEATGTLRPVPALRLEGAVAFNDGRIEDPSERLLALLTTPAVVANPSPITPPALPPGPTASQSMSLARLQQIPNIAKVTARAGAAYKEDLHGAELTIDGWLRYVGSSRLGVGPALGQRQGGYFDTSLTARLALSRFDVTLGMTNLLDTRGNRFELGTPFVTGRDQTTPLRPASSASASTRASNWGGAECRRLLLHGLPGR